MWFSEMRQMPRLRDCARELASQMLVRAGDLFTGFKDRWAASRARVEPLVPPAPRPRFVRWARPGA